MGLNDTPPPPQNFPHPSVIAVSDGAPPPLPFTTSTALALHHNARSY